MHLKKDSPTTRRGRWAVIAATALALTAPALGGATLAPAAAADCSTVAWMDTAKTPEQRADALLAASSQHQKYRWLVEQPANSPQQTDFQGVLYPAQLPCTPLVTYTDGPDGVRFTEGVTAFPAPISVASTWNTALAEQKGAAQGAEAFDKGKNAVLGPGLASGRTPLSGRTPEYFGEDPLLTGLLTAATVNGLEEGNPDKPVMSDLKHYVANEQELDRQTSSSNIDERTLKQVYELPFEIALSKSSPESVMCSYNRINGVYACENPLLNTNLKGDLGFDGYVVSDFGAVHSTAASLVNGLDQELNRPKFYTPVLLDAALAAGEISQKNIDDAARRVISSYVRAGLFDNPVPTTPVADASTAEHKAIARELAEQGTVLLKNDGALPLAVAPGATIAVIGATASSTVTDGVSAASVCSMAWRFNNAGTLNCEDLVSPETAIRERAAASGASVVFNPGTDPVSAAADAAAADVAIVFGYQRMGEFSDLPDLRLAGGGDALIETVAAANDSTIVVLNTGSAVEMPWIDNVSGVFEAWYGGEQVGPALAGLLFGDVNPSGKLPMTFPESLADTPTSTSPERYPGVFADGSTVRPEGSQEVRQVEFSEGLAVGYKWYESQGIDPLFAFGHGLSYTSFDYAKAKVRPTITFDKKAKHGIEDIGIDISFRVTNTGDRAGTEVAQAYLTLPAATGEPAQRLVGWERVALEPGQSKTVTVSLSAKDVADLRLLQYWDVTSDSWVASRGTYTVAVGGSVDASTTTTVRIP
ncbi:glycoside hydrolase family 3 C-terminal domain-containing protein [Rathayibacter sp. ZW T2_19]|uniref:Glycoside hydrolase family 3 C-terminal domain-containing protein n=1 Tax=Rathayibacter rubneri TaxID=2950106 RepID=A0A9X2DZ79_9MICO|nr:glycoside hydrolase family 3 C-terminal domain-containing protein [Rathayibacter rubneri]MCM6763373.1 glycoside hydrolase family 3 C-terminal domain-containing protein [Rathayibacter rubneri]